MLIASIRGKRGRKLAAGRQAQYNDNNARHHNHSNNGIGFVRSLEWDGRCDMLHRAAAVACVSTCSSQRAASSATSDQLFFWTREAAAQAEQAAAAWLHT